MARQQRGAWNTIRLAEAAGISQITMGYSSAMVDPMRVGAALPNLEHAGFFSDRARLPKPLDLGSLTPGWREFGMIGHQRDRELDLERYRVGVTAWVLVFEWHPRRSAWDALLEAQETIRPQRLSLTPDLLLPCMFLARMAHFPLTVEERGPAAQWITCAALAHTRLTPLLVGLFTHWLGGQSQAARRYRAATGAGCPIHQADEKRALTQWTQLVGTELLEQLSTTERPEPVIMRALEAASIQLWTDQASTVPEQVKRLVRGLLPIARWQPHPPGPEHLDLDALSSLEALFHQWTSWRSSEQE